MQQIQLNMFPFNPLTDNQPISFYSEKQKGFAPIHWDKLVESTPEGREAKHKNYYSDFQPINSFLQDDERPKPEKTFGMSCVYEPLERIRVMRVRESLPFHV